ncbi:MAG TPA: CcmD family protein [Longimicrobium sp.]|nr:CcmD family protein [Longimicrobium sp.]
MRAATVFRALTLALALALPAAPARAQEPTPAPATYSAQSGLPAANQPPRTLRAYWHLFAAFAFAWLMILGYAISLARRFRRLEEHIGPAPRDLR